MLNLIVCGSLDWDEPFGLGCGEEMRRGATYEFLDYLNDRCGGIAKVCLTDEPGAALLCRKWCERCGVEVVLVKRGFRDADSVAAEMLKAVNADLCVAFGDSELNWSIANQCKALQLRMLSMDTGHDLRGGRITCNDLWRFL